MTFLHYSNSTSFLARITFFITISLSLSKCSNAFVTLSSRTYLSQMHSTHTHTQTHTQTQTKWPVQRLYQNRYRYPSSSIVQMRDSSTAYWFKVGDCVKVVEDVMKAKTNLKGRTGTVIETWEKCDVDPTCCCAEQVDLGMAVHVRFEKTEEDFRLFGAHAAHAANGTNAAHGGSSPPSPLTQKGTKDVDALTPPLFATSFFVHYFAEDELVKVSKQDGFDSSLPKEDDEVDATTTTNKATNETTGSVAFDGMSCTAFKLQHLGGTGTNPKPRKIASYDPMQSQKND